jgi:hypothetical protein
MNEQELQQWLREHGGQEGPVSTKTEYIDVPNPGFNPENPPNPSFNPPTIKQQVTTLVYRAKDTSTISVRPRMAGGTLPEGAEGPAQPSYDVVEQNPVKPAATGARQEASRDERYGVDQATGRTVKVTTITYTDGTNAVSREELPPEKQDTPRPTITTHNGALVAVTPDGKTQQLLPPPGEEPYKDYNIGGTIVRVNKDGTHQTLYEPPKQQPAGTMVDREDGAYIVRPDGSATKVQGLPPKAADPAKPPTERVNPADPTKRQVWNPVANSGAGAWEDSGTVAQDTSKPPTERVDPANPRRRQRWDPASGAWVDAGAVHQPEEMVALEGGRKGVIVRDEQNNAIAVRPLPVEGEEPLDLADEPTPSYVGRPQIGVNDVREDLQGYVRYLATKAKSGAITTAQAEKLRDQRLKLGQLYLEEQAAGRATATNIYQQQSTERGQDVSQSNVLAQVGTQGIGHATSILQATAGKSRNAGRAYLDALKVQEEHLGRLGGLYRPERTPVPESLRPTLGAGTPTPASPPGAGRGAVPAGPPGSPQRQAQEAAAQGAPTAPAPFVPASVAVQAPEASRPTVVSNAPSAPLQSGAVVQSATRDPVTQMLQQPGWGGAAPAAATPTQLSTTPTSGQLAVPASTASEAAGPMSFAEMEKFLLNAGFDPDSVLSTRANYLGVLLGEPI